MSDTNTPSDSPSKAAILDSAAAILAQNPGASLASIAEGAGVGRATLHRYFPSRDDLICAIAADSIHAIDSAVEGLEKRASSASHLLELVIEAIVPLGERYHFLTSEASGIVDEESSTALERQYNELASLVDSCKAEGAIDPSVPTAWAVGAIDALIYAAWSLTASGHVARLDAAALVTRTTLRGMRPNP
ncbi:MAG: TetR/AcrR family transcriptional regulator [Planctomycetota bacterium]